MQKNKYKPLTSELKLEINNLLLKGFSQVYVSEKLNVSKHKVFLVANGFDKYERGNRIHIDQISDKVYNELINISENKGLKLSEFLRKELRYITEKYPNYTKKPVI